MLPRIEHPLFDTILPISKQQVKFRPLLVKEEKLIWKQENDCVTIEKPIRIPNGIALVFKIKQ